MTIFFYAKNVNSSHLLKINKLTICLHLLVTGDLHSSSLIHSVLCFGVSKSEKGALLNKIMKCD
ncbi:hypothetical protein DW095_06540 [Bacteroides sp. AM07-16]|nr:hypothetical protein DW095_06540 [Bacteroides sp. AM07-16]